MTPKRNTPDAVYYRLRLGSKAAMHGDYVICRWLGWAGADDRLARVRVVRSTMPLYRAGREGLVERERLVPMHPRRAVS